MWICFDCDRHFLSPASGDLCPHCGSTAIGDYSGYYTDLHGGSPTNFGYMDDVFIINGLLRCGIDYPTIFSLIWGDKMIHDEEFPLEIRTAVANICYREKGKEECLDLLEKKLHGIIIDLSYVLYGKQVNDMVEKVKRTG